MGATKLTKTHGCGTTTTCNLNPDQKTCWKAFTGAIREVSGMRELICKPVLTTLNWAKEINGPLPPRAEAVYKVFSIIKNGTEITSMPAIGERMVKSLAEPDLRALGWEIISSVHVFFDFTTMLVSQNILDISKFALDYFRTANCGALLIIQVAVAKHEFDIIYTEGKTSEQTNLATLRLAKAVSYIGLAVLGLVSFAAVVVLPSWAMLACSTSALVFSVMAFFYDRVVEPNKEPQKPVSTLPPQKKLAKSKKTPPPAKVDGAASSKKSKATRSKTTKAKE